MEGCESEEVGSDLPIDAAASGDALCMGWPVVGWISKRQAAIPTTTAKISNSATPKALIS
jgi:hypothetical protein